jgi:hypothetical protein
MLTFRTYYARKKSRRSPFMNDTTMLIYSTFFKHNLRDFYVLTLPLLLSVTCIIRTK